MSGTDHLEMAKAVLSAAIDAAAAVAAWGDYTAALMQATKAHMDALTEATNLEEQEVSYRSARGYDDDEGESRRVPSTFLKASSAKMLACSEIAEAFRRKTAAVTAVVEAKSKALGALDHASRLMRLLEIQ